MKKSKFLKKSLAMLLALMLVVAMIPLSASAAAPALKEAYVTVNSVDSALTVGDGTITGSISNTATSFGLKVLVTGGDGEVWYYDKETDTTTLKKATPATKGIWTVSNLTASKYEDESDNIVVDLLVKNSDGEKEYVVTLTPKADATDTSIKKFTVWNQKSVPQLGETKIDLDKKTIEITVPYDSTSYTVRDIEVAEGAVATVNGNVIARGTTVADGDTIVVTAGTMKTNYSLKITKASGFTTFTTKEGLDAIVFPNDNTIAILLPYGYTADHTDGTNITVTPVFELDYPSAVALDSGNKQLKSGETTISYPAADVIDDKVATFAEGVSTSWGLLKKLYGSDNKNWTAFSKNIVSGGNPYDDVTISYVEGTTRDYDVYFFEAKENNEALITELTIGSETATINQETKTIDITLPAGTNKAGIVTTSNTTKLSVTGSNNADMILPLQSSVTLTDSTPGNDGINDAFTAAGTLNASNPVTIRVTSEDSKTVNDYTLNVTVSGNYQKPAINTMTLKDTDGNQYEGKLEGKTFVFQVPYSVKLEANLTGWTLFYTKTVGASATCNSKAFPKSGAALTGSDDFIPAPGSVENNGAVGADIVVTAVNPSTNSEEKDTYNIRIDRVTPSEVCTLDSFGLYSEDFFSVDGYTTSAASKTVAGNKNALVAELPWSIYQHDDFLTTLGASFEATDSASRVYMLDDSGNLKLLVQYDDEVTTPSVIDGTSHTTASGTPITIVVLSERVWVNEDDGTGTVADWDQVKQDADPDTEKFTEYQLYVDRKDAERDKDLNKVTLIDQTGWTADLEVDVVGNKITGTIPYALTSAAAENPVYLSYDASSRAWVLAKDTTIDTNKVNLTTENIPNSTTESLSPTKYPFYFADGVDVNGNFVSQLYLIIDRDGDVKVYYTGDNQAAAGVEENKLVLTNEDGSVNYDTYTFDLVVAEPNADAYFESFSLNGSKGVIDNTNHTIKVTLPYGTEYTYMKPVFTTSSGAVVEVDDPNVSGYVRSGKTDINFSTARQFTVTAEDEKHSTTYDVIIEVSDQFTDVNPGDWFYDNVMDAAANGYMTGEGNGIFNPYGKTTRAAFACIIANVMGFNAETDEIEVETAFPDVPASHWAAKSIAFCVENGYLGGYEDGTFRPDQAITRQEAAAILNNTFGLSEYTTDEKFVDDASIATWARSHVYAVKAADLMSGDVAGTFRPNDFITRAEAASIMMNANRLGFID